jgi:hypothetical protein
MLTYNNQYGIMITKRIRESFSFGILIAIFAIVLHIAGDRGRSSPAATPGFEVEGALGAFVFGFSIGFILKFIETKNE